MNRPCNPCRGEQCSPALPRGKVSGGNRAAGFRRNRAPLQKNKSTAGGRGRPHMHMNRAVPSGTHVGAAAHSRPPKSLPTAGGRGRPPLQMNRLCRTYVGANSVRPRYRAVRFPVATVPPHWGARCAPLQNKSMPTPQTRRGSCPQPPAIAVVNTGWPWAATPTDESYTQTRRGAHCAPLRVC